MTTGLEQQLHSFAASLRSRRHRLALLLLFGWLLLAQTLLVVHRFDHANAERGAPCTLCVASAHSAGAAVPLAHHIPPPAPDDVASIVRGGAAVALRAAHRSRAPPSYLQS
jgi:hypothetical protein